jgi:hypothetical protein
MEDTIFTPDAKTYFLTYFLNGGVAPIIPWIKAAE